MSPGVANVADDRSDFGAVPVAVVDPPSSNAATIPPETSAPMRAPTSAAAHQPGLRRSGARPGGGGGGGEGGSARGVAAVSGISKIGRWSNALLSAGAPVHATWVAWAAFPT